jgi:Phage gp6-like head-tail connector protein
MTLDFSRVVIAAPLVSLATVKFHLRVTDALHDADIAQKAKAAQDRITAYLTTAADATWTETTVPTPVAHAILLLTTHWYEHRGDDMAPSASGSTPDADVWKAIENLLAFYRDPTLA